MSVMATEVPDRGYEIPGYDLCLSGCGYWIVKMRDWQSMPAHEQEEALADGFRPRAWDISSCRVCAGLEGQHSNEDVIAAWSEGISIAEVAERFGVTAKWVRVLIRRHVGADRLNRMANQRVKPGRADKRSISIDDYDAKMLLAANVRKERQRSPDLTHAQIAEKFGTSAPTVGRILRMPDWPSKKYHETVARARRVEEYAAAHPDAGFKEIADAIPGESKGSVWRILTRAISEET